MSCQPFLRRTYQFIIDNGKNRFKNPEKVVETLNRAARESYRLRPALASSIDLILITILQTLRALQEALKEVDRAIEKEFKAFPNTPQSIKGLGPVYSAGIFSEIGEIRRFPKEESLALRGEEINPVTSRQKGPEGVRVITTISVTP